MGVTRKLAGSQSARALRRRESRGYMEPIAPLKLSGLRWGRCYGFCLVVLVSFVAGVSTAGCVVDEGQVDPTKLAALKEEPLATMKLPGGRLVLQSDIEADSHPSLYASKPTDASI